MRVHHHTGLAYVSSCFATVNPCVRLQVHFYRVFVFELYCWQLHGLVVSGP